MESLFTHAHPTSTVGKIIQFPLIRMGIIAFCLILVFFLHNVTTAQLVQKFPEPYFSHMKYVEYLAGIVLLLTAYRVYTHYIEKRKAYEISFTNSHKEFGAGMLIGSCLVFIMVLLLSIIGYYRIDHFHSWEIVFKSLLLFSSGAFIQEFVFRVVLFRLTEELAGTWVAICITAVLFGFIHISNDNATIQTSIAIMIGDVLLAAAFIYTRRIWFVWGIHTGWNYFQDGIFGMPNSGMTNFPSWIESETHGPEWLTGGSFGIEASYIAILLFLLTGLIILRMAVQKNQLISPCWKRKSV